MSERNYFVGIDFGFSKTRCTVLTENASGLRILNLIEGSSFEGEEKSEDRYKRSIEEIADNLKSNKLILKSFTSNMRCNYFNSIYNETNKRMLFPFKKVSAYDIRRCRNTNHKIKIMPDEKKLEASFNRYYLDGKSVLRPLGLKGNRIKVETTHFVTKTSEYLKLQSATSLNGCILEEVVPSHVSYQSFIENLEISPNQFILLIDFGKKQTKITVSNLYQVLGIANFEIGGDDFTEIISNELLTDFKEAEKIKCAGMHPVFMEDYQFEPSRVKKLARHLKNEVYVLSQMINQFLKLNGFDQQNIGKIVLAGGGSKFMGVKDIIRSFFKTNCVSFGEGALKYQMNLYVKPEYYCSLGLALHSYNKRSKQFNRRSNKFSFSNIVRQSTGKLLYSD